MAKKIEIYERKHATELLGSWLLGGWQAGALVARGAEKSKWLLHCQICRSLMVGDDDGHRINKMSNVD